MNRALMKQRVRILGPIEAWRDDHRLDLGGPRQLALFAFLLLHADRAVPSDVLTDVLWGPARSRGDNRLQMAVARLRKSLAPLADPAGPVLRTVRGGYLLSLGSNQLDAEVFAARVQDGLRAMQTCEPALASRVLSDALAVWRGPPLAEVAYEDFAQGEIRRLEELRRVALETRIDAELRLGRHRELIGELGRLLAEHSICERITAQLMLALYRSNRQADALEVYDRTRVQLSAQLGLEPGPTLKGLQTDILAHAPSLKHSAGTSSAAAPPVLARSPLTAPSERALVLHPSHVPGAVDSERHGTTRAEDCSTCTSFTTEIRWQGSPQHWYRHSWTARPTQHTGAQPRRRRSKRAPPSAEYPC
jgi:DNA-binding SARP family transcriptional activator